MSDTEEKQAFVCRHGSLWCGRCRHNVASAMSVPGRPKYEPSRGAHKRGLKASRRQRKHRVDLLIQKTVDQNKS
jgi:hypothetical protein